MTFFSILFALLAEQFQPLRADNPFNASLNALALRAEGWFNAGDVEHGKRAWFVVIISVTVPTIAMYWICLHIHPLLALVFNVAVLYLTMGFRHYSHFFSSIQTALTNNDNAIAREILVRWVGTAGTQKTTNVVSLPNLAAPEASEIARLTVEQVLVTSHRHVFGVFFWFLLPIGPIGPVFYRVTEHLANVWNDVEPSKNNAFGRFALRAFYWVDWIPARLTAITFAIVGNFEDAIFAWRNLASRWQNEATGILLSAGSGALGVRLGNLWQTVPDAALSDALLFGTGSIDETILSDEASGRTLQSAVGLVWRTLLLWLLVLLLLSIIMWLSKPISS